MAVAFAVVIVLAMSDRLIERFLAASAIRQAAIVLVVLVGGWICYRGAQVTLNGLQMISKAWTQARSFDAAQGRSVHTAVTVAILAVGLGLLVLMLSGFWHLAAWLRRDY